LPELSRPGAGQIAAIVAVSALALVLPLVSDRVVEAIGVRGLACVLLVVSGGSLLAVRSAIPGEFALRTSDSIALLGLVGAAALSGERTFLLLVPAWVQLAVFGIFRRSLRNGPSVFERIAFAIEPYAPDFIRPYCRTSTAVWSWLFFANAVVIAALAVFADFEVWRAFTGWIVWAAMAAFSVGDYLVRKVHFRAYSPHPLDRLLAWVFPPEATEMGRRSMEYRRAMRLSLGRPP
jgi:uncharacterized membrane protein